MTSVNAPFGFNPVYHPSGIIRPRALYGGIASGYATAILQGAPVLLNTAGVLNAVAANNVDFVGSFAGCEFVDSTGRQRVSNFWPAALAASNIIAYFYDDPQIVYEIQADGSVVQTAVGDQVNFTNFAAGSTTTGLSQITAGATPVGVGVQGQLRVVDAGYGPDNAWGDAFTVLRVMIARHQYIAVKPAI